MYIMNEEKIYDRIYVEKVLGIKIPLQESVFGYSSEFRSRVLKEHILYENFITSLATYVSQKVQAGVQNVKNTVDNVKNLAISFQAIMTDSGKLTAYIGILKNKLGKLVMPFRDLLNKIEEFLKEDNAVVKFIINKFPTLKNQIEEYRKTYTSIKDWIKTNILDPITNLAGWGGALLGSTIYVIMTHLNQKYNISDMIKNMLKNWISGTDIGQQVIEKFMTILKTFITSFWDKIKNTSIGGIIATLLKTGFKAYLPWLQALAGIVGTTAQVADILSKITSSFINRSSEQYVQQYAQAAQQAAAQAAAASAAGRVSLARGYKQAPIQQSGYASQFMTNAPGAPATPAPTPIREHSNIGLLLQYLNE